MVVRSNPLFYSKEYKYADTKQNITISKNTNFILTGRKSSGRRKGFDDLKYYWRLVSGKPPSINEVSDNGCDIKMTSPDTEGEINMQLRVVDKETGEEDINFIKFKVV